MALPLSLVQDGPEGLGRRGQVLNWIGAKRYEALRDGLKTRPVSEAQAAL